MKNVNVDFEPDEFGPEKVIINEPMNRELCLPFLTIGRRQAGIEPVNEYKK